MCTLSYEQGGTQTDFERTDQRNQFFHAEFREEERKYKLGFYQLTVVRMSEHVFLIKYTE
jgi:hypothetical protein